MTRVLVVEDDLETGDLIAEALTRKGYAVDCVGDGPSGEAQARERAYDLLVFDRMLPDCDGLTIVARLRVAGIDVPVLFLSALGSVEDRVRGLQGGGDDYLAKPYALSEFLARVEALMRRRDRTAIRLACADLELDLLSRTARRGGREIALLPREFQVLELLMRHAGHVVTRSMLLEKVWNYHFDPQTNVVDVHISHLRQKIDRGETEQLLETVPGSGYRLHASIA